MWRSNIVGLLLTVLIFAAGWHPHVPTQSLAEQNLLHNSGFEAGTDGWSFQPSTASFEVVSAPAHQGERAAALTKVESRGWAFIYQDVSVSSGETYSAQGWAIWNDAQLTNVKLRLEWLDESGERLQLDEIALDEQGAAYQQLELASVVAPTGATTARVEGYTFVNEADPDQPALFDDFYFGATEDTTVTPTPEPTSTAATTPTVGVPTPSPTPTQTPAPVPAGAVVINEVFYDPPNPGGDPDEEWVELYNTRDYVINLEGWMLADHIGEDVLPAVELPPQGFVVVAPSDSFAARYPLYDGLLITLDGPIGNGLANGGDSLWFRDDQGRDIDAMAYGDDTGAMFPSVPVAPEGHSLERVPAGHDTDTAADWFPRATPSPGQGIGIWRVHLPFVVKINR